MSETAWQWDSTLYAGSATYYVQGRAAYPDALIDAIATALDLDGTGRLLDIGCGPGSLTLPLASRFAEAVGVDADADMLVQGQRTAEKAGIGNVTWRQLRAEELPADLGTFRAITFAQSFHWMDRTLVAATAHDMLDAGGACVHVHATTHQGIDTDAELPHPQPPRAPITALVRRFLGPAPRAGQGYRPAGTPGQEPLFYQAAGFTGPQRITIPGQLLTRTTDEVVASVFSLSGSTPHLLGDHRGAFETQLRELLVAASPTGVFSEQLGEMAIDIWRPSA
jgi:SAM-dependent methyltransferase